MKIGKRLTLGFAVLLALSILTAGIAFWRLQAVAEATRDLMAKPLTKERMVDDWYRNIHTSVRRTTAIAKSSDPVLSTFFADDTAASTNSSTELQTSIKALLSGDRETALFDRIGATRKEYIVARDIVMKAKKDGDADTATEVLERRFIPAGKAYLDQLRELVELQRGTIDQTARQIDGVYQQSRHLLALLCALSVALSSLCAWLLTVSITAPLNHAVAVARRVAKGDLTADIPAGGKDETGLLLSALGDMNGALRRLVGGVRGSAETIAVASREIASGNADLSSRTETQASSLEETASSMAQLTSTVRQNADSARQAKQLAASASAVAQAGGAVVSQVVGTMQSIKDSSSKIVDIISVIDGIAFQTNILALNAAVEAARAGEQGCGFAVVAAEVRNLAQRSASAAKEIKTLIGDSVGKVDAGSKLVDDAGKTMEQIVSSVRNVLDIMAEITAASQEQSVGINEVNSAVGQMDQMTQQNAALVEQAAAAADSLQQQAQQLMREISSFQVDGPGAGPLRGAIARAPAARPAQRPAARPARMAPVSKTSPAGPAREEWEEF